VCHGMHSGHHGAACLLCRMTQQEAQEAYESAPLSHVTTTNQDYTRVEKVFQVRHALLFVASLHGHALQAGSGVW
jgi:hypothetical protein